MTFPYSSGRTVVGFNSGFVRRFDERHPGEIVCVEQSDSGSGIFIDDRASVLYFAAEWRVSHIITSFHAGTIRI